MSSFRTQTTLKTRTSDKALAPSAKATYRKSEASVRNHEAANGRGISASATDRLAKGMDDMTTTETVETKASGATKVPEQAAMVKVSEKVSEPRKGAAIKEFRMVPLGKINILPDFNIDPKRMTDEASLRRLATTIEASGGLIQPILVGAVEEKGETKLYLT